MLDAVFGWKDGKTSRIYTARADRAKPTRQAVLRIKWDDAGAVLEGPEVRSAEAVGRTIRD
ncbi:hypothetical protein [Aureimonas mangrovi]|uniref:hypothetical protein n=1 Tax=Aureimonas mangrovi TaxID=2758041 RepID=UPI00163D4430|nr:hypothetical protein [Aureimonas mangrovi]